jgi:hypothetical protein
MNVRLRLLVSFLALLSGVIAVIVVLSLLHATVSS